MNNMLHEPVELLLLNPTYVRLLELGEQDEDW